MNFLENKIRQANKLGQFALIPFVMAGFPCKDKFWDVIEKLDQHGADIIEIGIPFSDPVVDEPIVEKAALQALEQGVDLEWVLQGLKQRKLQSGIVLMGYFNPFLQYGLEKLAIQGKLAGVHACIIPDLPLEESMETRQILSAQGLDLIPLIGLNTSFARMQEYSAISSGYAYLVSILGFTDSNADLAKLLSETIMHAKKAFKIPIALGFGLQKPEQLDHMASEHRPDAIVFESALLKHLDAGFKAEDFIHIWKNYAKV